MSVLSKLADSLADSGDDIAMLSKASSNLDDVAARKAAQFELLQKTNPMLDNYHTGIRSAKEINRLQDLVDKFDADNMFTNPDFTIDNARAAVAKGTLPVFSSKPIEPGVFVSPSKMMATDYAGGDASKVFSKEIPLDDFAAILSGDEGNYLPIARAKSGSALGALTPEQEEFFKDSVIREPGGSLKTVYHGTNADFNTFGEVKTEPGYWFTEDKDYAASHGKNLKTVNLNIKNPLDLNTTEGDNKLVEYLRECFGENASESDIYTKKFRNFLKNKGYDGMIWEHSGKNTYIAFEPNQIKSTSNKKPTLNPDIMLGLGALLGGGSALASMMGETQPNDTI